MKDNVEESFSIFFQDTKQQNLRRDLKFDSSQKEAKYNVLYLHGSKDS